MNTRRLATTAGAVGLVAGAALGVTGLASAAGGGTPTPSPTAGAHGTAADDSARSGHGFGRHGRPGGHGAGEALVLKVSAGSLQLDTPGGTRTVALNATTTYFNGVTAATLAAVTPGELVHVRLVDPRAAAPVAAQVRVVPAHLAGYVTARTGGTLTVLDQGGFQRTVRTGTDTKVVKDGAAGTLSDITVGSFVQASGTAQGVDLQAARLATGLPGHGDGPNSDGPNGDQSNGDGPNGDGPNGDGPNGPPAGVAPSGPAA